MTANEPPPEQSRIDDYDEDADLWLVYQLLAEISPEDWEDGAVYGLPASGENATPKCNDVQRSAE